MNSTHRLMLIGAIGTAGVTACKHDHPDLKAEIDAVKADLQKVNANLEMYLQDGDLKVSLRTYLDRLSDAVCQLENQRPAGLDPNKRICTTSVPPDKIPIPGYPPKP